MIVYDRAMIDWSRMPARVVTRFAPSPTGHLHLGHVANAVWTWGVARAAGGEVVLRMEDHDRGRCRAEYEASILDDLAWLGLRADHGEDALRAGGPCAFRQSDHPERYAEALCVWSARAQVYGCGCSRRELVARGARTAGDELRYDGFCRARRALPPAGVGVRIAMPDRTVTFHDLRLGPQVQHPAQQSGDVLLRERNGYWTYQCCVVVDDAADGISLVVRGTDILASTGRQILLAESLGIHGPATWLHHPLILADDGRKLSKREAAQGIRELRAAGWSPEHLLGEAAWRTGLLEVAAPISVGDLPGLFAQGRQG